MSCSVAVSNSPVFSPSSSLFCNNPLTHLKFPSSPSSTNAVSVSSPGSSSPFRIRLQKPPIGESSSGSGSDQTVLKRKRPAKLAIPVVGLNSFSGIAMTPREGVKDEIEEERDGVYSVYCKKGRREAMEDRFSAVVDFNGDSNQVNFRSLLINLESLVVELIGNLELVEI